MSRDDTGTYTLPAGNPVVTDTTITTQWANSTLNDIATALTNSLSRNGRGGMNVPLQFADGTATEPSITFESDTNTGLFLSGSDDMRATVAGTDIMRWIDGTNGKIVEIYDVNTSSWSKIITGGSGITIVEPGTSVNQAVRWEGSKYIPTDALQVSEYQLGSGITGNVGVGFPADDSGGTSFFRPRMVIYHHDTGESPGDINLSLGTFNPCVLFTENLINPSNSSTMSFMGLVTSPKIGQWSEYETQGDFIVQSKAVSIRTEGAQEVARLQSVEIRDLARTSINVFNKNGSSAVSTRTNGAQLMVASPMQTREVVFDRVNSIVVTDNVINGSPDAGVGNGGSIAFASGTNLQDEPKSFATIRGYVTDSNELTAGAIEIHARALITADPTQSQSLCARFEGSSVECIAPLILWETYDVVDPTLSVRGIVSDAPNGFNYAYLTSQVQGATFSTFGFTVVGTSYNAHVNGGNAVQIGSTSDYRLKDEIGLLENAVDKIKLMRPIEYTEKEGENYKVIHQGFIAHEMQAIIPTIVNGIKDDVNKDGEIKPQSLYYAGLTPILVKAVQELTARIEALEA
tara:strand:- start:1369 stop:3090 length:1722 start_codon:yes stop_codon:yes gene_type:complete